MSIPECMEAKLVDAEYLAFWESLCTDVPGLSSRVNKLSLVGELSPPDAYSIDNSITTGTTTNTVEPNVVFLNTTNCTSK